MGLFSKKVCDICGGEIGLLGNRKLVDGNLCKNCAAKLSPWTTDRRQSTVEEIRQHLEYRERNARVLLGVNPTRVYGHNYTKIYVDENQGTFFVSGESNYMAHNPDVLSVSQVIGFRPSVHENRTELYHHDREGRRVPYNPRRYQVDYRFDVEINVSAPFFSSIHIEFSGDRPDSPRSELYRALEEEVMELQSLLTPANYAAFAPTAMVGGTAPQAPAGNQRVAFAQPAAGQTARTAIEVEPSLEPGQWKCEGCGQINNGKFCPNCGAKKPVIYRCDKCGWQPTDPNNLPKFCPNCGDPFNEEDMA